MKTEQSIKFSNWIIRNSQEEISPLKLQKLIFYCFAAASSRDLEDEIGSIEFDAWKYGPVVVPVYKKFKEFGASDIPVSSFSDGNVAQYSQELSRLLRATLNIYGRLTASALVHQTHLEDPWIKAYKGTTKKISNSFLKTYFKRRFGENMVTPPEMLKDTGFFEVDGLPVRKFSSIEELANSLDQ